jgi:hypothetical protein
VKNNIWILIIVTLWINSCSRSNELSLLNVDFGRAEYYKPFMFKKMESVVLEREFEVSFNENSVNEQLILLLLDEDLKEISSDDMTFYLNGEVCENGKAIVKGSDKSERVKIGVSFSKQYDIEGRHSGFIVVANPNSFDEVSSFSRDELNNDPSILQWEAEYDIVMNPVLRAVLIFLALIILFILFWFLALRNKKYPKFQLGKLQIVNPYHKPLSIRGYRQVILTNSIKKQGWFDAVWRGRIRYEVHDCWTEDVIVTPKRKNNIKIKLPLSYRVNLPLNSISKSTEIKFQTDNKEDVKIKYS